jgi:3-hydroxyisobutyrate dehydrogenase
VSRVPENEKGQVTAVPPVGVIGLGDMGGGIAHALVGAEVDVTVCDLREEATAPFREGARVAATPAALAAETDVVVVVVFSDAQVRAVLQGPDGVFAGARAGTVVVVVSTIPTASLLELRAAGAEHDVAVLDCGVSGGPDASAAGDLVCMIGGSAEEVERVRPVLDVMSCLVLHMGPPGAGLAAKLARNLITYGSWLAAFEAQELAEAAGRPRSSPRRRGSTSSSWARPPARATRGSAGPPGSCSAPRRHRGRPTPTPACCRPCVPAPTPR